MECKFFEDSGGSLKTVPVGTLKDHTKSRIAEFSGELDCLFCRCLIRGFVSPFFEVIQHE